MSSWSEASFARARSREASDEEVEWPSVHGTTQPAAPRAGGPTASKVDRLPELRTGTWTRLGGGSVLGDAVTEGMLGGLAERTRAAARAQGYAVGWAEGRREADRQADAKAALLAEQHAAAEARRDAEHRAAVEALGQAAADVRALLGRLSAAVEEQATDLAWALTEAIVGVEVESLSAADVVRRVQRALPAEPVGTVRLHPAVAASVDAAELRELGLRVTADASLGPADALVDADGAVTDLRISTALERVREVLA